MCFMYTNSVIVDFTLFIYQEILLDDVPLHVIPINDYLILLIVALMKLNNLRYI